MTDFVMPRTVLIVFEDDSTYHGAEVRCRANIPIKDALELAGLSGVTASEISNERVLELIERFTRYLISWNLVDENGEAIPIEAAMEQPAGFLLQVFKAWSEATAGVPKGSSAPSLNGRTLAAASVTTEPQ